jgi:hypothetical protein
VSKVWLSDFKPEPKLTLLTAMAHGTIFVAAKQFHITPMGPMIGVMVFQLILIASQCQATAHFELGCVKSLVLWVTSNLRSQNSHC